MSIPTLNAGQRFSRLRDWAAQLNEPTREEQLRMHELADQNTRRLAQAFDDRIPLPSGAAEYLTDDNPRLAELRHRYLGLRLPSVRDAAAAAGHADLRYFRGESVFASRHRELPRAARLKLFIYLGYVKERDDRGLIESLGEDGLFGCWTDQYPGQPTVSRDLLESVNQLLFLQLELSVLERPGLRVLDVGAGYGGLAHRMSAAALELSDYCCVDGAAESTFVSEYYLRFRDVSPPARVVALDEVEQLESGQFDLAISVHELLEGTRAAATWWVEQLRRLKVPTLFLTPSEADGLRTTELDGSRLDLMPVLAAAGYRQAVREPAIDDEAVREIVQLEDHFSLFTLEDE